MKLEVFRMFFLNNGTCNGYEWQFVVIKMPDDMKIYGIRL